MEEEYKEEEMIVVKPDLFLEALRGLAKRMLEKPKKSDMVMLTRDPDKFRREYIEYINKKK